MHNMATLKDKGQNSVKYMWHVALNDYTYTRVSIYSASISSSSTSTQYAHTHRHNHTFHTHTTSMNSRKRGSSVYNKMMLCDVNDYTKKGLPPAAIRIMAFTRCLCRYYIYEFCFLKAQCNENIGFMCGVFYAYLMFLPTKKRKKMKIKRILKQKCFLVYVRRYGGRGMVVNSKIMCKE